jgi:hypothetical protein
MSNKDLAAAQATSMQPRFLPRHSVHSGYSVFPLLTARSASGAIRAMDARRNSSINKLENRNERNELNDAECSTVCPHP